MRRMTRLLVPALLALSLAGSALASGRGLTVEVNQSRRIVLGGAIANVVVGDPTVADVVMIDAHSVIVVGKGYGATQVMVIDRAGRALLDARVTVVAADQGRVTVYRGVQATDYSCSGRCQAVAAPGGGAAPAAAPASTPAASTAPQSLPGAP